MTLSGGARPLGTAQQMSQAESPARHFSATARPLGSGSTSHGQERYDSPTKHHRESERRPPEDPMRRPEEVFAVQGPERPRVRRRPPFAWQPHPDYEREFRVSGESNEVLTKVRDFKDRDWVIPAGGSLRMYKGGLYHWTLAIERKCPYRPQFQLGVHAAGHRKPWRLVATSRCSRARDEEAWIDRPGGDRTIEEGDYVHLEVDLRGLHLPFGTFSIALNREPWEVVFDDIPLNTSTALMPVVSMGGDQARVRLCPI